MIFFTSDSHFNDESIIKRQNRPFKNVKDCDRFIIKTWNSQTTKDDTIYHIGDFCTFFTGNEVSYEKGLNYVKKIKANVILIIGNNEERLIKAKFDNKFEKFREYCLSLGFKDVKTEEFLEYKNNKLYLNHFPSKHKDGYINIFGHLHRIGGIYKPFGLNIGCDLNYLKLYSVEDVLKLLEEKRLLWDLDPDVLS